MRYDNTNPAELYVGTTWELVSSDKYIRTGNVALQTGGNNTVSITKANLPNIKLKVESFSLTTQPHNHSVGNTNSATGGGNSWNLGNGRINATTTTSSAGGQNTGTASPNTETLGSGTPLSVQPEYITLKFWKRLS